MHELAQPGRRHLLKLLVAMGLAHNDFASQTFYIRMVFVFADFQNVAALCSTQRSGSCTHTPEIITKFNSDL